MPKFLINPDGSLGERNDISCVSIEHKLGIHGSPTCVLQFGENGGAVGELIGHERLGMGYMFTMMNQARLAVGLEGLAVADRAYQLAVEYANERLQGRRPDAPKGTSSAIVEHPDVRRMLLTIKAQMEALRCLVYLNAAAIDHAHHHPEEDGRRKGQELTDLLTPLSKGWGTDLGNELTSLALQVHGGAGYIEEAGAAQHYRDIRIAAIYEGTNGIQAIDLVGRKLAMRDGGVITDLLDGMGATVADLLAADMPDIAHRLESAAADAKAATVWLLDRGGAGSDDGLAGATPYLRLLGVTVGGWLLAKSAVTAARLLAAGEGDATFLAEKITTAHFFATQVLPQVQSLLPAVTAGAGDLYAVSFS